MPETRIAVVGASAGGFEAARALLRALPADLPAAVLVVIHTGPAGILPASLSHGSPMPVGAASDGQPIEAGRVYVAPPDRHLTKPTLQQARASKQLHGKSRAKTRPSDERPRRTDGRPRKTARRRG